MKPENPSHELLLFPRATAWGQHLLPLAPVHNGAREGSATPTQGPLAHHWVTPSYQAEATAPPQAGIEAEHTGVTANHHGVKVQHTQALQAAGPGKGHVGLATGKHAAQGDLHAIQGHALGMERQRWSQLCLKSFVPQSLTPPHQPSYCPWISWPSPGILRQRDRLTLDGYLSRRGSRRYIQDKREG